MKKIIQLSLLLILCAGSLFSIERKISNNVRFHSFTVEDGLLTNTVYTIFQDRKGFMWFGTQDGVNRYDGVEFERIAPHSAVGRGLIHHITENPGPDGDLLIATSNGLYLYGLETETVSLYDESLESLEVTRVFPLAEDSILLSLSGRGLYLFDSGELTPLVHNVRVLDMLILEDLILAATDKGILLYDRVEGKTVDIVLKEREVLSLLKTDQHIIAGTDLGLYKLSVDGSEPRLVDRLENVNSLLVDSQSRLWTGSDTEGLTHFCEDFSKSCRFLNGDTVISLYIDRSDNLWVGYLGAGLKRVDTHRLGFSYLGKEKGLENTIVVSIWEDKDGSVWLGTFGGGLFHFSEDKTLLNRYAHDQDEPDYPGDDRIMGLFRDSRGRLWIGTKNKGLFYLENNRLVPVRNSYGSVYTISEDKRGRIWAITQGGGIHILDGSGQILDTILPPRVPTRSFRTMLIDGDFVYLGTVDAGLAVLNLEGELLTHYSPESLSRHGLKGAHILSFCMTRQGTLWVGTLGGGLHGYNRETDSFRRYTDAEGLPNNTVYGILEDDEERLWISTNRGIALFNPELESFTGYTVADGLQGNEFNSGAALKGSSSTLYMGGVQGLSYFDPSGITENRTAPETLITRLGINNREVAVGELVEGVEVLSSAVSGVDEIILSRDHLVLTLHFRGLHFSNPEGNRYEYILEGLEPEWIDAGDRNFSTYTSLPPGKYVFRVRSMGGNGVWSDERSLAVTVMPEFYQMTWFRILMISVVLSVLLLIIRIYLSEKDKKFTLLEGMVAERTEELETALQREKKMREFLSGSEKMSSIISLTARMAHNLNTPLGSTKTALSYLRNSLQEAGGKSSWLETCDIALDGTNKASQIVQQLSAASNTQALPTTVLFDLSSILEEYIQAHWVPALLKEGIRCEMDLAETDARLLGSISSLQETIDCLLSNTVEHAFNIDEGSGKPYPDEKIISLKTVYSDKEALLLYRDNGRGISKELQGKIFEPFEGRSSGGKSRGMGLFLVYNLIRIHFSGQITVLEEDRGVCFQIKFPLELSKE